MTTAVQRRRGTNTEHASFTGLEGEISVNTTNESVHVHDGSTAGGFELMRADGANSTVTLGDISGVTAGTGLSGGGTTGTVTLDIDGTVATLAGTQTFTNKTLTSPILNTPTIGTSFTIGGATITEAELEILDGATVSTTELNYVDGVTSSIQTQIDEKAPLASPSFTGNVSVGGTVDGRDVAADGTKLDGIEASADVTDTANVTAAGAVMDSELTSEASVKALNQGVATTDSPAFAGLTVDTDTLAVDSTNNRVGIGTASPNRSLEANSTQQVVASFKSTSTDSARISFSDANTTDDTKVTIGSTGDALKINTLGSERMRIDSSGKVGIGTTTPASFAGDCTLALNESGGARLGLNGSSRFFYMGCDSGSDRLEIGRRISSNTTDSPDFVLNGSGLVGIGTTSPSAILDVKGAAARIRISDTDTAGTTGIEFVDSGGTKDAEIEVGNSTQYLAFKTATAERMRIDGSGNLLVGTTSVPSSSVSGVAIKGGTFDLIKTSCGSTTSTKTHHLFINGNGNVGSIQTSGSTTAYNTSSDQRLKENIADADDAGSKIDAIQVRKYDWKVDGSHQDYGMIAQELLEVAPEAVSAPEDSEEMMGVDYSKLVPMLIKEIQSLRNRVAQLEE